MKRRRSSDDLYKDPSFSRSSSSHRNTTGFRKVSVPSSSSSRYDRDRKRGSRYDYSDRFDTGKGYDRYKEKGIPRSESFCGSVSKRGKWFRSERDRCASSWKQFDDYSRSSKDRRSFEKLDKEKSKELRSQRSKSVEVAKRKKEVLAEISGSEMEEGELEPERGNKVGLEERENKVCEEEEKAFNEERFSKKNDELIKCDLNFGLEIRMTSCGVETKSLDGCGAVVEKGRSFGKNDGKNVEIVQNDDNELLECDLSSRSEDRMTSSGGEMESLGGLGAVEEKGRSLRMNDEEKVEIGQNDDDELIERDVNSGLDNRLTSSGDETESLDGAVGEKGQSLGTNDEEKVEIGQNNVRDEPLEEVREEGGGMDIEVQVEYGEVAQQDKEVTPAVNSESETEKLVQNSIDKGKSVAVASDYDNDTAVGKWTGKDSQDEVGLATGEIEGSSTRGFELFSSSPVRKQEKCRESEVDRKLKLEPLDLSLSLPNVLLPIGARESSQSPNSPSNAMTVTENTFQSDSDAFTASISYSGSQSFFHNPSCLTRDSLDNLEESVKSRPIFKGVDWQALSQNESQKETPFSQMIMMNGDGSTHQLKGSQYQCRAFQGKENGEASRRKHIRQLEGNSKGPNGLERQLSSHKQSRCLDDVRSSSHTREIVSNYSFDNDNVVILRRSNSQKEQEQPLRRGIDLVGKILTRIIFEPMHVMAGKFHEMTIEFISSLKESIREMMLNPHKCRQVNTFQMLPQNRSDTTMEMLLNCHRAQLEILVALKTDLPDFLRLNNSISSSDLAEIYLNSRCRNLDCRSLLPVHECDCKVCAQRDGFCSACMCIVCSKFDMASNTCGWVGCDVCLHWCHANCALQANYIRNGLSATGPPGSTEMQFHCVACEHPSEMFGFVKEVFQNFAKEWTAETFKRELEYVKRIFSASKDARGIKLHKIADQMLAKLASKSSLPNAYSHFMSFLADGDSFKMGEKSIPSGSDLGKASNGRSEPSQEPPWLQSCYNGKTLQLEKKTNTRTGNSYDRRDGRHLELVTQRIAQKEPLFDELESIVRIKEAEAKMFQARADDARREAEGLKRIAVVKNEKIVEEYTNRIAKLQTADAQQKRKQKLEELQALERAHLSYFNMKMRLELDLRTLLSKMEATNTNLSV